MRKILPFTLAAVVIALLYLAWVAVTRFGGGRQFPPPQPAPARLPPKLQEATGTGLKILHFYAHTGELTKGEHLIICYGVRDARAVRLEPPVETLSLSPNRCFVDRPKSATTYRLVAQGADGAEVSASFTVNLRPAPPSILFVAISQKDIRRGQPLAVCYGVKQAVKVRLDPGGVSLPPMEKSCIQFYPARTTAYTLVATGEDGRTDREQFTVGVK